MAKIGFMSFVGFCEVAAESRTNRYVIRLAKNGSILYFWFRGPGKLPGNNEVAALPKTTLTTALLTKFEENRTDLLGYMNAKDTVEGIKLYWKVRTAITGATPKDPITIG